MSPAFTPGPWVVQGPFSVSGGPGRALAIAGGPAHRITVATVGFNNGDDLEVCRADADLIAAAPEMYEALAALMDPEGHIPHGSPGAPCTGECRAARAALAKAVQP